MRHLSLTLLLIGSFICSSLGQNTYAPGTPIPAISITSNTGDTVCYSTLIHFSATVTGDTNVAHYKWIKTGSVVGSDSNIYTPLAFFAGDYVRCLLLNGSGDALAFSNYLFIDTMQYIGTITPSEFCVGNSASIRCTGMGYFLEPGAGFNEISSDTDIIKVSGLLATAMATGSVTVYVVATNHCGVDSSSITISVTTNTLSPVSGPDSLCAGSVMVFTDLSSGGNWSTLYPGYFDYNIDPVSGVFNSGYSFYGPAFITYGTPSCNVVDTLIIEKAPISAPISGPFAVVVGATVTYANDSAGGIWSISNTALATIDPHTGVLAGLSAGYDTLYYTTTNATGCTYPNNHIIHILADPESVSSINNTASFTVYPNPATGNLNITWAAQSTGNGIVTISDVSGRTVYASSIEMSAANHARLDISSLKTGVYMISLQSGTGYYCSKLVVGE